MSTPPARIRIIYDSTVCIGNKACVKADPHTFKFDNEEAKAILVNGTKKGELHVGEKTGTPSEIERAIRAAASCPVNAFRVEDAQTGEVLVGDKIEVKTENHIHATYDDRKDFVLDPAGYFLIRINYATNMLEAGFCNAKNQVVLTVSGTKPIDVYHTIATSTKLNLRQEHYAYLGRELEKAYYCVLTGKEYVQDDELHTMKPRQKNA